MLATITHTTMAITAGVGRVRVTDHGHGSTAWYATVLPSCFGSSAFAGTSQNSATKRLTRRPRKRPT